MWRAIRWTMLALLAATSSPLRAEVVVATVDWSETAGAVGTILDEEGRTFLRVEGAEGPRVLEVLVLNVVLPGAGVVDIAGLELIDEIP